MAAVWFRNLFRPEITTVRVQVYENGNERDVGTYDEHRLSALCFSVDALWNADLTGAGRYWFETDAFVKGHWFRRSETFLEVTCYERDVVNRHLMIPMAIPIRYRKRLFDKMHTINPRCYSNLTWPARMEVRFVSPERV